MLEHFDKPYFTDPLGDNTVDDPLGTEAPVMSLYRSVFPGINNVVAFVRVYSAICWMVRQIDETASRKRNPDIAEISATGLEKIQLLLGWYNVRKEVRGLAGGGRVYPTGSKKTKLSVKVIVSPQHTKAKKLDPAFEPPVGANFLQPVQYGPSIVNGMQFLCTTDIKGAYALTAAGEKLADAYERAIARSKWRQWLADLSKLHICNDEVAGMGTLLDLRKPSRAEVAAFLEQYYPVSDECISLGPNWELRQEGLTLALRAVFAEQKTRSYRHAVPENAIRFAMARACTHDGRYELRLEGCEQAQMWWASLLVRQYLRLAQSVMLRLTESWIHRAVALDKPRDILDCANGIGADLLTLLPVNQSTSVGELAQAIEEWRGEAATLFAAGPWLKPAQRLESLFDNLMDVRFFAHNSKEEGRALRSCYVALVYCGLEARNFQGNSRFEQTLSNERLTLLKLSSIVEKHLTHSPAKFMAHIVQHYVVLQHFAVVQERAARDGRSRYLFIKGDSGLQRIGNDERFVGADWMQDRLLHALRLLSQCRLLTHDEDKNTFSLTKEGLARLDLA